MKKFKNWLFRILILILIGISIFVLVKSEMLVLLTTGGDLSGKTDNIPVVRKKISPLENGINDWLSWRGKNSKGLCDVKGIIKDWSNGLEKVWEVDYLCQGKGVATWSSPVVNGNRLVICGRVGDKDIIFCLDPETGELIWSTSYMVKVKKGWGSGARATPFIDGDRIYTFGRAGDLCCLKLLDGKILWRVSVKSIGGMSPGWGHASSPLVIDNKVIIQCGGDIRSAAFDKMTGKLLWSSGKGVAGYAAITFMEINGKKVILEFHGKGFSGLEPETGKELWNLLWKTQHDVNATTPVSSGDSVFITSGYGRGCALVKIDGKDTRIVWENETIASHHSDPYIIDGFIYGYSGQSMQNSGKFKCIELKTGKEMWSTDEMGWGTCLKVDGYLICQDIKGNLFLMKPDPEKFILVSSFPEASGKIKGPAWTIPVIAGNKLYLRLKQHLVCYMIKQKKI